MAIEPLGFPQPTTTTDDLEDLYMVYRVDRGVVLDLASASETPETPILEILAELGLSFTQVLPNFLRHLITFLVRAREEGLPFGFGEFCHQGESQNFPPVSASGSPRY
ncbi:hypothetical protein IGI04_023214 [Brassica rapa subsp. trilocularis]|uniref:Uncharacterized protein n=1 Tax=Brassica rapa subsp. trilocularis TaxID=1813537 RepID=A0ABQ7M5K0_BRACM|nr:hypothetical protein IGI04_023214 [Brassica rapa subsp. trilocularis]